jgi:hypothetical protein
MQATVPDERLQTDPSIWNICVIDNIEASTMVSCGWKLLKARLELEKGTIIKHNEHLPGRKRRMVVKVKIGFKG